MSMATDIDHQIRCDIGARIRQYRKDRGLSQMDLARRLDTRQAEVSSWENGHRKPNGKHLERIAAELNIHWHALVSYDTGCE